MKALLNKLLGYLKKPFENRRDTIILVLAIWVLTCLMSCAVPVPIMLPIAEDPAPTVTEYVLV